MEIFKFGGASVKDAASVKNVLKVLRQTGDQNKVIVISAMGKMTNAFEVVIKDYLSNPKAIPESLPEIRSYHLEIINGLFQSKQASVYKKLEVFFEEIQNFMVHNKSTKYDFVYDQLVCFGELISSTIVSEFFTQEGIKHTWIDARTLIKTDNIYRDASVNWVETQNRISKKA